MPDRNNRRPIDVLKCFGQIPLACLCFLVVFLLSYLGVWLNPADAEMTTIWLSNAAVLAILIAVERHRWWLLLVVAYSGNVLANALQGLPMPLAGLLPLCNTLEVLLAATILTLARPSLDLGRQSDLAWFLTVGGVLAPGVSALIAATLQSSMQGAQFSKVFVNWFAADAIGTIVLVPALLIRILPEQENWSWRHALRTRALALFVLSTVVTYGVFSQSSYPLLFLILPFMVLAAFESGFVGAATSLIVTTILAITLTSNGTGPLVLIEGSLNERIFALQVFLATSVFLSLLVAANLAERTRLAHELRIQTEMAERANRTKSSFLATMSHELRTPLTSIRGALGLIEADSEAELPKRTAHLLRIAHENSKRLVRLINDILDMEKIESGKLVFDMQRLPLRPLLENAIAGASSYLPDRRVRIVLVDDAPGAAADVDPDRLQQVISNLLSNAIKYSPVGGTVTVGLSLRPHRRVRIRVRDTGRGIPEPFRSRIFGKFEQADHSNTREMSGTGLGLSISKAIVDRLGGSIGFYSAEGVGSTFYIDLPNQSLPDRSAGDGAASQLGRVLICEADPHASASIAAMLAEVGYASDAAPGFATARALLAERDYTALTLDIWLGGNGGAQFLADLRGAEGVPSLPVVVISASARKARDALGDRAAEVVGWIEKPVDADLLQDALERVDRWRGARKPRVLHLEDDDDVLEIMRHAVGDSVSMTPVRSLSEARAKLATDHFDLVILDVGLPDGSGLDLLPEIPADTCVIVFSATDLPPVDDQRVKGVMTKTKASEVDVAGIVRRHLPNLDPALSV